jgi:hypothetical protein
MKFKWSALIIDEGHRLKGEGSLLARELRTLGVGLEPCISRITEYPVQLLQQVIPDNPYNRYIM